jgi:molybdate transport system substrate-binding protein
MTPRGARRGALLRAALGLVVVGALVLAGCGAGTGAEGSSSGDDGAQAGSASGSSVGAGSASGSSVGAGGTSGSSDELSGTLTVFAAASLTVTFDELRTTFMEQHPGVTFPEITYDGSATLAKQIQEGAPADVFASADEKNMDKVATLVTDRVDFASNTLRIAVAPGNPKHITGLADLAKDGVVTVICAPEVPCGSAAHTALDAAGVTLKPASEEQNVTAVLTKVASGDADAGLVYATDVESSGGTVEGVDFPQAAKAVNVYPIAALADSNQAAARAFIDLVTGDAGHQILAAAGFGQP